VQGRASTDKAKNLSKNLSRCRSRDTENGLDHEDVLWRAAPLAGKPVGLESGSQREVRWVAF
jgi:hypothetical protein